MAIQTTRLVIEKGPIRSLERWCRPQAADECRCCAKWTTNLLLASRRFDRFRWPSEIRLYLRARASEGGIHQLISFVNIHAILHSRHTTSFNQL